MEGSKSLPINLQPSNLRPIAYRILSKKHGLNIKTEALSTLTEVISYNFGFDWKGPKAQQFLEEIGRVWKLENRGLFIDGPGLKQVIKEVNKSLGNDVPVKAARSDTLADVDEEQTINWEDYFKIINPPDQPHFKFDRHRKQFGLVTTPTKTLADKLSHNLQYSIDLFSNRYYLLMDRLSRNENFQKTSFASISSLANSLHNSKITNEITLVKNLLGRDGSKFIIFGLLSKNSNGDYILEDCTDYIELNLRQTYKTPGLFFSVGMFVIVEGIYSASGGNSNSSTDYIGGCFYASNVGHPPAERREISDENYGNIDFLGIHKDNDTGSTINDKVVKISRSWKKKLTSLEKSLVTHKIIMLGSDCFLDLFKVCDGLEKFFSKLESNILEDTINTPPLAIVMVGSFVSKPFTATSSSVASITNSETYKGHFDNLSTILSKFPNVIKSCKFILVPGKNDPWQSSYSLGGSSLNYYPQRSIPQVFTSRLERILPKGNLIWGWNPLRINYLSQEIIIFKDELMNKFKRNDIIFESDLEKDRQEQDDEDEDDEKRIKNIVEGNSTNSVSTRIQQARKLVKTLLDQGNLQPFLKDSKLTDVVFDHTLRLEPAPNTIVLHDANFDNFEVTYNGCKVINISKLISTTKRRLNYAEYYPSTKKFHFKELYF